MRLVFTKETLLEVNAMRSFLASHGIPSILKNEFSPSIMGEVPFFETWPEIWVAEELYESAKIHIEQAKVDISGVVDWFCCECQEENPGTFELCWHCGLDRSDQRKDRSSS